MNHWVAELLEKYGRGLGEQAPWGILVVVSVALSLAWPRLPAARKVRAAIVVVAAAIGTWAALRSAWVCDDAFISFRYARNLVAGQGLVFNPGERVEGYTNFLWTLMSALVIALGVHPGVGMTVVSVASFVLTVVWAERLARRLSDGEGSFPVAAVVVALGYTMTSYATSGLETMFAALLVLVAVERAESDAPLVSGICGVCAVLSHPDHALFYVGLAVSIALTRKAKDAVRFLAPFAALYVPYLAFRYAYYGDLLPNTYYAKSGGLSYFEQGLSYLAISGVASGLLALAPVAVVGALSARRRITGRFLLFGVVPYLVYVAKIGGDFMLGRLVVAVIPILAVLAEHGALWLSRTDRRLSAVAVAVATIAAVPARTLSGGEKFRHVADEATFYQVGSWSPLSIRSSYQKWADELEEHVVSAGLSPLFGIGCLGIVAYDTNLPIVDTFGLNDRAVARKKLRHRGRPGHEKQASAEYLMSRAVDFSDWRSFPPAYDAWTTLHIGGLRFFMGRYDPGFVEALREDPEVRVPDVPTMLDRYQPPAAPWRAACDLWFFDEFYLEHSGDERRRKVLASAVGQADASLAGYEDFLLGETPPGFQEVARYDFSPGDFEKWEPVGTALSAVAGAERPGQGMVVGHEGPFASSYDARAADAATGALVRRFRVEGEVITLRVGGGTPDDGVGVTLKADGDVLYRTAGCRSEALGRRVFPVPSLLGDEVELVIEDASVERWGHVVVDEIVQWARAER